MPFSIIMISFCLILECDSDSDCNQLYRTCQDTIKHGKTMNYKTCQGMTQKLYYINAKQ